MKQLHTDDSQILANTVQNVVAWGLGARDFCPSPVVRQSLKSSDGKVSPCLGPFLKANILNSYLPLGSCDRAS